MFLKNTMNVFGSNFTLTYRLLLYKILLAVICCAVGFATILPLFAPVISDMQTAGVFDTLTHVSESAKELSLFYDSSVSVEILEAVGSIKTILVYHSSSLVMIYIAFALLVFFWYLTSSAIDIGMLEVINFFCKQKSRRSLMACFISRFVDVCKYTLCKLCLILPIELCILALSLSIYIFNIGGIFAPALMILVFYGLMPAKETLSICFAPCLVASEKGAIASFKHGLKLSLTKWIKVYSTNLFILIVGSVFIFTATIMTLGALTVYAFAMYAVYKKCVACVIYYNLEGMRFYCDSETIVTPLIVKVQEGDYTVDLL